MERDRNLVSARLPVLLSAQLSGRLQKDISCFHDAIKPAKQQQRRRSINLIPFEKQLLHGRADYASRWQYEFQVH